MVLAIGNPPGLSGSGSECIASATGRAVTGPATTGSLGATLPSAIQTSAQINPGNSGGALVDTAGELIGIPARAAASPARRRPGPGHRVRHLIEHGADVARQLITAGHLTLGEFPGG